MSNLRRVVWIDDNPGRASTANDLGARFINVKGKELATELQNLLDGSSPKLIIIDHVLDKAADKNALLLKGSTIAGAIKERWPSCAVVGVTNADTIRDIDLRTKSTYDAIFPFQNFGNYFERISGIANGFAAVSKRDADPEELVGFLKGPRSDLPRLKEALSDDLKNNQDASVPSRFYRWVDRLIERPGFLFDRLWSATFLGLTESGFARVERRFERAKYKGIFSREKDPRWWVTRLSEVLYKLSPPEPGELSWHVGRRLPRIKPSQVSSCYYCSEAFPEIVAYLDEKTEERRPMHLKCTTLHPRFARELYFEDLRIML